jgi:endonuclease YncB( thermonuclease family)
MKNTASTIIAFLYLTFTSSAHAETLVGHVASIVDGDTIVIVDSDNRQNIVRLMGIDAPGKSQAYGNRAQAHLGALLTGQLEVAVEWHQKDGSGTIIGKVLVAADDSPCHNQHGCPKTVDVNLQQLKAGMAWWHTQSRTEQSQEDRATYEAAEFDAKTHRRGLWADSYAVPPWKAR